MPFCPICKGNHDPKFPCSCRSEEYLRDAGIKIKSTKKSRERFRKIAKKADRAMFKVLIFGIVILFIIITLSILLE
jgi:hypothetical protein